MNKLVLDDEQLRWEFIKLSGGSMRVITHNGLVDFTPDEVRKLRKFLKAPLKSPWPPREG